MALRIFTGTSIVTTGNAITAATNDTIIIAPDALYAATGTPAQGSTYAGIAGPSGATNISIQVNGTLAGVDYGIDMYQWSATGSNTVTVGAAGLLIGNSKSAIYAEGAEVAIINYGEITSYASGSIIENIPAIDFDSDRAYLFNAGTIFASQGNYDAVNFQGTTGGARPNILINTGEIISTSFDGSNTWAFRGGYVNAASDQIWNSGLIVGSIFLDQGNDIYQGGGRVVGQINGGGGNDQIIGGAFDDTIVDTGGGNWLVGGDGDDTITIGNSVNDNQIDHVFGGIAGGADTSLDDTLVIDISEAASGVGNNVFLEAGYVTMVGSGSVVALFNGFENVTGTGLDDALIGNAADNILDGGLGNDWLVGNAGADTFQFSTHTEATGDNIRDFSRIAGDKIDLSKIDANVSISTDQAFAFVNTHTNDAAGEVVITNYGSSAVVELYLNGDNIVDGSFIVVFADVGMTSLTRDDFIL